MLLMFAKNADLPILIIFKFAGKMCTFLYACETDKKADENMCCVFQPLRKLIAYVCFCLFKLRSH